MQFLLCATGLDSVFCPKIPVSGNISGKDTLTIIGGAKIFYSLGNGSAPTTTTTDYSGNFSSFVGGVKFNVTIKSKNQIPIGYFSVSLENDLVVVNNVSTGLTVTATKNQSGVNFTIRVTENSFFSFLGSATGTDMPSKITQTTDGGYLIVGSGDVNIPSIGSLTPVISNSTGTNDCFVAKLNSSGEVTWYSFYGGTGNDNCLSAEEVDGGFLLGGTAASGFSSLGGVSPLHSFSGTSTFDGLLIKIQSNGTVQWFTFLGSGGTNATMLGQVLRADDGTLVLSGSSHAALTTFAGVTPKNPHSGGVSVFDQFVLKLNSDGTFVWVTYFGGSTSSDTLLTLQKTLDGGYVGVGNASTLTSSIAGVSPKLSHFGGISDQLVIKIDSNGNLQWYTYLGSGGSDDGSSIYETPDGGIVVAGKFSSSSVMGGKSPIYSYSGASSDCVVSKLNSSGELEWFTFIGYAVSQTSCTGILASSDDHIVLYGYVTASINTLGGLSPQYPFSGGTHDLLIVKLSNTGVVKWYEMFGSSSGAEQSKFFMTTHDGGFIFSGSATGQIASFDSKTPLISFAGSTDYLLIKLKADGKF